MQFIKYLIIIPIAVSIGCSTTNSELERTNSTNVLVNMIEQSKNELQDKELKEQKEKDLIKQWKSKLKPTSRCEYIYFLQQHVALGGKVKYDKYTFDRHLGRDFFTAQESFTLTPAYGANSESIIVPKNVNIAFTEQGVGHNDVYFMKDHRKVDDWPEVVLSDTSEKVLVVPSDINEDMITSVMQLGGFDKCAENNLVKNSSNNIIDFSKTLHAKELKRQRKKHLEEQAYKEMLSHLRPATRCEYIYFLNNAVNNKLGSITQHTSSFSASTFNIYVAKENFTVVLSRRPITILVPEGIDVLNKRQPVEYRSNQPTVHFLKNRQTWRGRGAIRVFTDTNEDTITSALQHDGFDNCPKPK